MAEKVSKREQLIDGAIEVIGEKSYGECAIKDITKKAGVAVGTFYTYFQTKEEILMAIYEKISKQQFELTATLMKMPEKDPIKRLICTTAGTVWHYSKTPKLTLILLVKTLGINLEIEQKYFEIYEAAKDGIVQMMKYFKPKQGLIKVADERWAATAYMQVMNGIVIDWIRSECQLSIEEICYQILIYNFKALQVEMPEEVLKQYIQDLFVKKVFEEIEMGE